MLKLTIGLGVLGLLLVGCGSDKSCVLTSTCPATATHSSDSGGPDSASGNVQLLPDASTSSDEEQTGHGQGEPDSAPPGKPPSVDAGPPQVDPVDSGTGVKPDTGAPGTVVDSATPVKCVPGEFVQGGGCSPCPNGTASTTENATECSPAQVVAGARFTCVLLDGEVKCWGSGANGRLGYGNTDNVGDVNTPDSLGALELGGAVERLSTVSAAHSCAVRADGKALCWGERVSPRLDMQPTNIGDNETPSPAGVIELGRAVSALTASARRTCAVLDGGHVTCWRADLIGATIVELDDVPLGASSIGRANSGACALVSNGAVRCWGIAPLIGRGIPEAVDSPSDALDAILGSRAEQVIAGDDHMCALTVAGEVLCWGSEGYGQLGYPQSVLSISETPESVGPVAVPDPVEQIAANVDATCALTAPGDVYCWGLETRIRATAPDDNQAGRINKIDIGRAATYIDVGLDHACAMMANGDVRCWGANAFGQLGYGHTDTIGDDETPASAGNVPYR